MASKRHKDGMGGWKEFRPNERAMVEAMLAAPLHVAVTMRTKTEYVEQLNERTGKKERRKIGLMPVQREGLEYEFDLVAYMDDDNNFQVDKTRCPDYSGKIITKPKPKDFEPFRDWLKGAKVPVFVTREQAEELHYAARARQIPNATLLAQLNLDRLGALPIERLSEARAWIASQPEPHTATVATSKPEKTFDDAQAPDMLGSRSTRSPATRRRSRSRATSTRSAPTSTTSSGPRRPTSSKRRSRSSPRR